MPKAVKASKKVKAKKPGLTQDADGNYKIRNKDEALLALKKATDLQDEMARIALENDLPQKTTDYEALRKALAAFQDSKDILELTDGEHKSLLVERTESKWVLTDEDIPEGYVPPEGEEIKSLTAIFKELYPDDTKFKRMFNKITRRVLDTAKLNELVKDGTLKAAQVDPAYLQYVKTRYVKVGEK